MVKTLEFASKDIKRVGGRFQGIQWICKSGRVRTANVQILGIERGERKNHPNLLIVKDSKGNYLTITLNKITYLRQDGKVFGKMVK